MSLGLNAADNSDRFPFLSRLPKSSIIRQKCLESPYQKSSNDTWLIKEKTMRACKNLEKQVKYCAAEEHGWQYVRKNESLTRDEKQVLRRLEENINDYASAIIYGSRGRHSNLKPEDHAHIFGLDPKDKDLNKKFWFVDAIERVRLEILFAMAHHERKGRDARAAGLQEDIFPLTNVQDEIWKKDALQLYKAIES